MSETPILIAHSGGGINGYVYTNSQEAILQSIANGYRVIEVDVSMTSDGVPVLTHDFKPDNEHIFSATPTLAMFLKQPMECGLTPLTLVDFLKLVNNFDGTIILDIGHSIDKNRRKSYLAFVSWLKENPLPESRPKILLQACSPEEVKLYKDLGYDGSMLHYSCLDITRLKRDVIMLVESGIQTISIANGDVDKKTEDLEYVKNANIFYFVHTVNHMSRLRKITASGAAGVFTDRLLSIGEE